MTVVDKDTYRRYRAQRDDMSNPMAAKRDLLLSALLFGSIGAIAWAVRGTNGWGGIDGTLVPGLTWGLLWYYVCWKRGIDARGIALWLGLTISIGGELGYGQYVSWIRGTFTGPDGPLPISPWVGYLWLFICGTGWGATGGIALGWVLAGRASALTWITRLSAPVVIGLLAWRLVRIWPLPFFPHYGAGFYAGELTGDLDRTVFTNTQNFAVFAWWFGAMLVAAVQRDKATLVSGGLIGAGFGITFMVSTMWCLGYGYAPTYIDWWKLWEMSAGFFLGAQYAVLMYWAMRRVDAAHDPDGTPRTPPRQRGAYAEMFTNLLWSASCFFLVLASGYEYFRDIAILLGLLFFTAMCMASIGTGESDVAEQTRERRLRVTLIFAALLLAFILLRGASSRAGVFLGLYDDGAVGQYEWPAGRVALIVPAIALVLWQALLAIWNAVHYPGHAPPYEEDKGVLSVRMLELLVFIGAVGAVSIWPEKTGVLYSVALAIAVAVFYRFEQATGDLGSSGD